MNLARWLWAASLEHPDQPALLDGELVVADYTVFAGLAARTAERFRDRYGVRPGDRVALHAANTPEYLVALFGTWWAGAVVVPVNAKLHPLETAGIFTDAGARLLLLDAERHTVPTSPGRRPPGPVPVADLADVVALHDPAADRAAEPPDLSDDELAWVFYTSGTTGPPKGAMLTHGNLVAASLSYLADVAVPEPATHYLYAAPISHGAGLYAPVHVRMGARHVFPVSRGFDAGEVLDLATKLDRLALFAAPTMVRRLTHIATERGTTGTGLDTVVYGGGPMYLADIRAALDRFGDRFVQIYGQGESPMTITVLRRDQHRPREGAPTEARLSSVGTPHSCVSVRVVDGDGQALSHDEVGEIEVRGPVVMQGYWNDPAATERTLRDGWLRTGDLGSLDARGFLSLRGRSKEVVITGGSNVYPREVEDVLVQHRDVAEAAVIGLPDEEWGEVVVAVVVASPGRIVDADRLDAHCLDHIARFKRPKWYVIRDELPKNAYGKILKTVLIAEITSMTSPQPTSPQPPRRPSQE